METTRRKTLLGLLAFLVPTKAGFAADPKVEIGKATFYHNKYVGRKTTSGEIFSQVRMTCAHRSAPLGSKLRVTNLQSNAQILVKVTDRLGRTNAIVDLTWLAAQKIGITKESGWVKVSVEML